MRDHGLVSTDRAAVVSYVLASVAMVALIAAGLGYVSVGLVAPPAAVVVLVLLWLGLVLIGVVWFRRHPLRVLVLRWSR